MALDADYVMRRLALGEAVRQIDVPGAVLDELVRRGCTLHGAYVRPDWTKAVADRRLAKDRARKRKEREAKPLCDFKRRAQQIREAMAALLAEAPRSERAICVALDVHVSSARHAATVLGVVRGLERAVDGRGSTRNVTVYRLPGDARPLPPELSKRDDRWGRLVRLLASRSVTRSEAARVLGVSARTASSDLAALGAVQDAAGRWGLPNGYEARAAIAAEVGR